MLPGLSAMPLANDRMRSNRLEKKTFFVKNIKIKVRAFFLLFFVFFRENHFSSRILFCPTGFGKYLGSLTIRL